MMFLVLLLSPYPPPPPPPPTPSSGYLSLPFSFPVFCESAWPSGKALGDGKRKDLGSTRRFGSPFSFKNCGFWTLSRDFALHN